MPQPRSLVSLQKLGKRRCECTPSQARASSTPIDIVALDVVDPYSQGIGLAFWSYKTICRYDTRSHEREVTNGQRLKTALATRNSGLQTALAGLYTQCTAHAVNALARHLRAPSVL